MLEVFILLDKINKKIFLFEIFKKDKTIEKD
nr:MAG TPA: hypothetical protein [Caudoviricetes sp.]